MTDGTDLRTSTPFGDFLRKVGAEHAATRSRVPSDPIGRERWPQVRKEVTPREWESMRGLAYRSCTLNDLPNSWNLLKDTGLLNRNRINIAESVHVDLDLLAHAMRVPDDVMAGRFHPVTRSGFVAFFGVEVKSTLITSKVRRFSPTAFRRDLHHALKQGTDAATISRFGPYHRSIWELREIPFCLDHWDMLQDRCWCENEGVVQRWTRTATSIHECDSCGNALHEMVEAFPVPEDMRADLAVLRAMVHLDPAARAESAMLLPAAIREVDRSRLHDIVHRLANAIDPDARLHRIDAPRQRLSGLWQACRALLNWRPTVDDLPFHPKISEWTRRELGRDWCDLAGLRPALPGRAEAKRERRRRLVGIRPAGEIAKLSMKTLRQIFEAGLLPQHYRVHGDRRLPAFDAEEMEHFGKVWSRRINASELAAELGISLHGVEQLAALHDVDDDYAALDLLVADAPALPGTGPHFHPEAVDAFLDAIENRATDAENIVSPVSLSDAMRSISGRAKPWGPAFAQLLKGAIPYGLQEGKCAADCIVIPTAKVAKIRALTFDRNDFPDVDFADRLTQGDALEMFNISANGRRILDGIPCEGINPIIYRVTDIEEMARDFVALTDLAAALGMIHQKAYEHLHAIGHREERPGVWKRSLLAKLVGASR